MSIFTFSNLFRVLILDHQVEKPIDLRNPPLFYAGHLPAFSDIHVSRHFDEPLTEPAWFAEIFERGIDPDVNDPTQINHSHSKIPEKKEDWPTILEIINYSHKVRQRIVTAYEKPMTRRLGRVLAMLIEHDAFHLETSLYIALQASEDLDRPIGWSAPDWNSLARAWDEENALDGEKRRMVLEYPGQIISIGQNDDDRDLEEYDPAHNFGWDCESE